MLPATIALTATDAQKAELNRSPLFSEHRLIFADDPAGLLKTRADAYMDLTFELDSSRMEILSQLRPAPIFVNSVIYPLGASHDGLIRINGWPGFIGLPLLEAAGEKDLEEKARRIFGEYIIFVKDVPGLVNPRIISMIVNEAYFTLAAGTSTAREIDIAMKLGTGYPMGPFEWAEKIGLTTIRALLMALSETNPIYIPATGIIKE